MGGIFEKERGRFGLGPLLMILITLYCLYPGWELFSAALTSCNSKLDLGSWQVSPTCAIIYIGKGVTTLAGSKYVACYGLWLVYGSSYWK